MASADANKDSAHGQWSATFVDANATLAEEFTRLRRTDDVPLTINRQTEVAPAQLPTLLASTRIAIVDHTFLPTEVARECRSLKHVVFLGTGARSYMNPEELAELGIAVHTIKGYGDTAVAECAFAHLWAGAKGLARMDRGIRSGNWWRTDGMQLTGKTLGIVGFGGIAAELARLAQGIGMRVVAWNRTPKTHPRVEFVSLDEVLAQSHAISLHLLLNDETRNFLNKERIAALRPGAIIVNTARGALIDEDALVEALKSGRVGHAGLDVFTIEPLPGDHVLATLPNVTLSAHSAFRTPEATANLVGAALEHCRRITLSEAEVSA